MPVRLLVALTFLLALLACDKPQELRRPLDPKVEEPRIRESFEAYKRAILANDGAAAAALADSATIAWYERCRVAALQADADALRQWAFVDRYQVLSTRHRIGADLKAMDGQSAFKHMVDKGWVAKLGASELTLGRVSITDTFASGEIVEDGKSTGKHWSFICETDPGAKQGRWRLELLRLLRLSEPALRQAAAKQSMTEDVFMMMMLESVSGRKVGPDLWEPLEAQKK